MFNVGAGELILIVVVALLVLGPQKLPEFARTIGKFVREFRRQTDEVRTVVEREFYKMDQEMLDEPRPPVHPATPAALPSPVPVAPPVTPAAAAPEALATATAPESAEAVALAASTPSPTAEPSAAGASEPDALPRLEPIPGTVARNAPKSG
ncbi:sec-independent protein translocase protein TatB [Archangium gephyra]|uniref:Sec-independent protein translocase protein TatB homolog n=1 Tax=Archangium gephyra TaxID=48 RepID=A0AAC8QGB9_9BACT|nr:Sec-independent protein translocase protein TatB [Archangium gephyra]AKJ06914.1 Twin-arginine translocation protein TatB [Archangium gephyra]REG31796.1 sec-independent protein translocase protein TatB [Archangium gephyra]